MCKLVVTEEKDKVVEKYRKLPEYEYVLVVDYTLKNIYKVDANEHIISLIEDYVMSETWNELDVDLYEVWACDTVFEYANKLCEILQIMYLL